MGIRWRIVAAASVVLVLSGCARSIENLPTATPEELEEYRQQQLDSRWEYIEQTSDVERPEVDVVRPIEDDDDWQPVMDKCMTEQGYDWYYGPGTGEEITQEVQNTAAVADYICAAKYPYVVNVLSTAQRSYLYDYYVSWLTPCYSMHGYLVTNVPTKKEFMAQDFYSWHPAQDIRVNWQLDENGRVNDPILRRCGYYPKFMDIEF